MAAPCSRPGWLCRPICPFRHNGPWFAPTRAPGAVFVGDPLCDQRDRLESLQETQRVTRLSFLSEAKVHDGDLEGLQ